MVSKIVNGASLKVAYLKGQNENGKDIIKSQRFSNLNLSATKEELYAVASEIASLIAFPLSELTVEEDSVLLEEEA
ncbi:MAG: DUF1659 domain-containing protein [Clostridium chrysemydis]|uniref:DUF1659 domain-containing protein n=1 Tax=Clostridium TaxID=1485 RepID=UPI0021527CCB|nr:DUF1659 domain-containing protein [Clostridium sp. LY3-2]MCR6514302.1 DUF1659 domain-containing protein [Clostridium sp. LY3-2]